jgi:hypothetical protein
MADYAVFAANWRPLDCLGDFDGDGDEDLADLVIFMEAFTSNNSPTANWNPDCDISNPADGVVDFADYGVFVEFWQRGCGN